MSSQQTEKRDSNRYSMLRAIQSNGPLKRSQIAEICNIRKSSITSLADELIEKEVICTRDPEKPRSALTFTSGKWFAVTAYVTEKEIQFARIDLAGKVYDKSAEKISAPTYDAIENTLSNNLNKLCALNHERTLGAGIALPGIVDSATGKCLCSINVPQINKQPTRDYIQKKLDIDVLIENDVRASLWAGIWFEHFLAQYKNVLYLDIAEGVSSALLLEGTPHAGANHAAGELGHMRAGDEHRLCRCGKEDCLETYCSIDALKEDILKVVPNAAPLDTAVQIAEAAEKNIVVSNILDRAMERLGRLLAVLIAYIDPEIILLGNQDPRFYQTVMPMLKRHLAVHLHGSSSKDIDIQIVPNAEDSALRGVAALVVDKAFQSNFE